MQEARSVGGGGGGGDGGAAAAAPGAVWLSPATAIAGTLAASAAAKSAASVAVHTVFGATLVMASWRLRTAKRDTSAFQNTRTTTIKPTTMATAAKPAHMPSRFSMMPRARGP